MMISASDEESSFASPVSPAESVSPWSGVIWLDPRSVRLDPVPTLRRAAQTDERAAAWPAFHHAQSGVNPVGEPIPRLIMTLTADRRVSAFAFTPQGRIRPEPMLPRALSHVGMREQLVDLSPSVLKRIRSWSQAIVAKKWSGFASRDPGSCSP